MMSCLSIELAFSISSASAKVTRSAAGFSFSSCSDMRVRPMAAMAWAAAEGSSRAVSLGGLGGFDRFRRFAERIGLSAAVGFQGGCQS